MNEPDKDIISYLPQIQFTLFKETHKNRQTTFEYKLYNLNSILVD